MEEFYSSVPVAVDAAFVALENLVAGHSHFPKKRMPAAAKERESWAAVVQHHLTAATMGWKTYVVTSLSHSLRNLLVLMMTLTLVVNS